MTDSTSAGVRRCGRPRREEQLRQESKRLPDIRNLSCYRTAVCAPLRWSFAAQHSSSGVHRPRCYQSRASRSAFKAFKRPKIQRLDRALRSPHDLADLFVRQPVGVFEDQQPLPLLGLPPNRRPQSPPPLVALGRPLRTIRGPAREFQILQRCQFPPAVRPVMIGYQVVRDAIEPRHERHAVIGVLRQVRQRLVKRACSQVLRVGSVARCGSRCRCRSDLHAAGTVRRTHPRPVFANSTKVSLGLAGVRTLRRHSLCHLALRSWHRLKHP